jgi:hypothetical protein
VNRRRYVIEKVVETDRGIAKERTSLYFRTELNGGPEWGALEDASEWSTKRAAAVANIRLGDNMGRVIRIEEAA